MRRYGACVPVLAFCLMWLTLPTTVLADDCRTMGSDERNRECTVTERVVAFFFGSAIATALAMMRAVAGSKSDASSAPPSEPEPELTKNKSNFDSQSSAYDPAGTEFGGGPGGG
jgi:hypothetical protein